MFSQTKRTGTFHKAAKIHALVEFSLGGSALAEEAACHTIEALHLVSERPANGKGQTTAHNGIATIKTARCVEDVHGAAAAVA